MKKPLLIAVSLLGLSACLNNDQLYSLGQIVEAKTGFGAKHPEAIMAGAVALSLLEQQNAQSASNPNTEITAQQPPKKWEVTQTQPVKMNPPAKQKAKTTKKAKTKK